MKKLGALLLAAALVMSMTACGGGTGIREKVRRHPAETPACRN